MVQTLESFKCWLCNCSACLRVYLYK